jgi:hypothetical protein
MYMMGGCVRARVVRAYVLINKLCFPSEKHAHSLLSFLSHTDPLHFEFSSVGFINITCDPIRYTSSAYAPPAPLVF